MTQKRLSPRHTPTHLTTKHEPISIWHTLFTSRALLYGEPLSTMNGNTLLIVAILTFTIAGTAQLPVGAWREHLPYGEAIDVVRGGSKVFCATPFAVFAYDLSDKSLERFSKVNKLGGSAVTCISYDSETKSLLVGHANGLLDIITGGAPTPLDDIARSSLLGNKRINSIYVENRRAYLCTGFGIVVVNIDRREVSETWFIQGQSNLTHVNSLSNDGVRWYASTREGIFTAPVNSPFLVSFETWGLLEELPLDDVEYNSVTVIGDLLYAVRENGAEDELWVADREELNWTLVEGFEALRIEDFRYEHNRIVICEFNRVRLFDTGFNLIEERFNITGRPQFPRAASYDGDRVWVANEYNALFSYKPGAGVAVDVNVMPSGPPAFNARRISAFNNNIWIASGGVNAAWMANFDKKGMYGLVNNEWVVVPASEGANEVAGINDIMSAAVHPDENNKVYFGSWEEGLIEVTDGVISAIYNHENSTLQTTPFVEGLQRTAVGGTAFDNNGNLWFSNSFNGQRPLHVMKRDGGFVGYNFQPQINVSNFIADILPARQGFIWAVLPRGEGILVFDHNGTLDDISDDRYRVLNNQPGTGGLPTNDVFCLEEDLNGEIWVGTSQGVAVFYVPNAIFDQGNTDAQQILIEQGGNIQVLLETEQINCIEIDGANRKWIGTAGSGVFLLNPNGQEQIQHFTSRNSPLLSDNVFDIAINHGTGEVFFATERGLVSHMSSAKNFDQEINDVAVYPNPVRPEYGGQITIDGLAFDSDVRITDTAGNLVYATRSNGGRAIWDGNGRDGRRVATGVYLVFAASPNGEAANVGKVAIIGN